MAEIRVPALGESVTEATIGKWFKKPGDAVAVDEQLVELETDKVTIEVPAPAYRSVNRRISAAVVPAPRSTVSHDSPRTCSRSSAHPAVCRSMNSRSTRSVSIRCFSAPVKNAASPPFVTEKN